MNGRRIRVICIITTQLLAGKSPQTVLVTSLIEWYRMIVEYHQNLAGLMPNGHVEIRNDSPRRVINDNLRLLERIVKLMPSHYCFQHTINVRVYVRATIILEHTFIVEDDRFDDCLMYIILSFVRSISRWSTFLSNSGILISIFHFNILILKLVLILCKV